jgi:PAS domain S-box-containing protein
MELSDEVLRGLLEAAPDAMIAVDETGTIVFANRQTEQLFGWDRTDVVGASVEVLVPERFAQHAHLRAGYLAAPATRPMGAASELWARRRDGSEFPVEISLSAIEGPEGLLVAAAIRDIADRLEMEAERARQQLESQRQETHRLESLGQLAGGVAHDFNNLLGVILNYATLAERGVDDPVVVDDIQQIRTAAERAAELTRQLLAFARRDLIRPEVVQVDALVERFSQMLARTIGEHITLTVDVGREPVSSIVDHHQLEQVLLNLSLNARDAMPGGGVLRIVAGPAEVGGSDPRAADLEPGAYVRIAVQDEGTGMPPEVVDRAFEPFFTTKPPGEGTGLGLATVYGIVQQNRGRVLLRSQVGAGTTVEVYLPRAPASARAAVAEERSAPRGSERILVVEDEERLRMVVARMLTDQGYDIVTAADGGEARRILQGGGDPIDLILTDVVMPGTSGPELIRELRAGAGPPARVLFMSGYAPTGRELDGEHFLPKPFSEADLFAAVRKALDA